TIRGDYGRNWGSGRIENIIHASDSSESAEREISIWFA
ncbi:MAG: nucleoside-diphosphate kinase, partial [Actinomycetaceae bacterium]|nr:nucleoside-diphosphate kinase [Actinomycetaceae bacterium]